MIVNYFPAWFRNLYGGVWPKSYVCIDCETTGFSFDRDVITEWGHCLVEDGKITDQLSLVIDWTNHATVPDHWLRSKLHAVRQGMELAGRKSHMTYERMQKEGLKPAKALDFLLKYTQTIKAKQLLFVAHNAKFEESMLCANLMGFQIAPGFTFGDNGFLDTECIEKASQAVDNPRVHPQKGDTLRKYFHRVKYTRLEGIKSNLDIHCFNKYRFQDKYNIDPKEMHGAKIDAFCCYLLMEEFRAQMTNDVQSPPFYPDADHKQIRKTGQPLTSPTPRTGTQRVRGQRNS